MPITRTPVGAAQTFTAADGTNVSALANMSIVQNPAGGDGYHKVLANALDVVFGGAGQLYRYNIARSGSRRYCQIGVLALGATSLSNSIGPAEATSAAGNGYAARLKYSGTPGLGTIQIHKWTAGGPAAGVLVSTGPNISIAAGPTATSALSMEYDSATGVINVYRAGSSAVVHTYTDPAPLQDGEPGFWVQSLAGAVSADDLSAGTWVDSVADTTAPLVTIPGTAGARTAVAGSVSMLENSTAVCTLTADESVTWAVTGGADAALFAVSAAGVVTMLAAPNFEAPGSAASTNSYTLQVTATDGASNATVATVTVNVSNVNEQPAFVGPSLANITCTVGAAITPVNIKLLFSDPDAGDTLTMSMLGTLPAGLSIDPVTGVFSGTPLTAAAPTVTTPYTNIQGRAADAAGLFAVSNAITITVNPAAGVLRTVSTTPYSRGPGLGARPLGLTGITLAVLQDAPGLATITAAQGLAQAGNGTVSLASTELPAAGTSVVVVGREADGTLGVERFTVA